MIENEREAGKVQGGEDKQGRNLEEACLQNNKCHCGAYRDHHPFMMYSANELIPLSTSGKAITLSIRHGNRRPVRGVLVLRPIGVRPTPICRAAAVIIVVIRRIIQILSRAKHRKSPRNQQPEPQQQIARYVGTGMDGAVAREHGRDVGDVPEDGEPQADVLPW